MTNLGQQYIPVPYHVTTSTSSATNYITVQPHLFTKEERQELLEDEKKTRRELALKNCVQLSDVQKHRLERIAGDHGMEPEAILKLALFLFVQYVEAERIGEQLYMVHKNGGASRIHLNHPSFGEADPEA